MNVSLTAPLEALIHEKVSSGFYNNASEVVREALRIMHERDQRDAAKLERLRTEAANGFESMDRGEFSKKSVGQIFDEAIRKKGSELCRSLRNGFRVGPKRIWPPSPNRLLKTGVSDKSSNIEIYSSKVLPKSRPIR